MAKSTEKYSQKKFYKQNNKLSQTTGPVMKPVRSFVCETGRAAY